MNTPGTHGITVADRSNPADSLRWFAGLIAVLLTAGTAAGVIFAVVSGGSAAAHADALCDQMRREHGPMWPCINVPTYTPQPTQNTPPPTGSIPGAPGSGSNADGSPGPGPGAGNGTPIIPVPDYRPPGLPGQQPPAPPRQTGPASPNTGLPAPPPTGSPRQPRIPAPSPQQPVPPAHVTVPVPTMSPAEPATESGSIPVAVWLLVGAATLLVGGRSTGVSRGRSLGMVRTVSSEGESNWSAFKDSTSTDIGEREAIEQRDAARRSGMYAAPRTLDDGSRVNEYTDPKTGQTWQESTEWTPEGDARKYLRADGYQVTPSGTTTPDGRSVDHVYDPESGQQYALLGRSPEVIDALDKSAKQQQQDQETINRTSDSDDADVAAAKQRIRGREQGYAVSTGTDENGRRVTTYTNPYSGERFSVPAENDPDQAADDALAFLKGAGPHTDPEIAESQARAALRNEGMIVNTRINPSTGRRETTLTEPKTGATRYITTNPDGTTKITDIAGSGTPENGDSFWSKFNWSDSDTGGAAASAPMDALSDAQKHMLRGQSMSFGEKAVLRYGLRSFGPAVGGIIGTYTDWKSGEMSLGKAIGTNAAGAAAGTAAGAATGALIGMAGSSLAASMATGAAIGSAVPVIGTAAGLIVGAFVGWAVTKSLQ